MYSRISYCCAIWGYTYNTHLTTLQKTQNQILRIIFNKYKCESVSNIYTNNNILDIQNMVKYFTLLIVYKFKNNCNNYFLLANKSRTRNQDLLKIPLYNKKAYTQNTVFYNGVKFVNSCKNLFETPCKISTFKSRVKTFLLSNSVT